MKSVLAVVFGVALIMMMSMEAQSTATAFEVATVRPEARGAQASMDIEVSSSGRVSISGVTLKDLISIAFDVGYWRIDDSAVANGKWMAEERYDIRAKAPDPVGGKLYDERHGFYRIKDERLQQMLRSLLEDRFQLKFHRGSKEGNVYALEQSSKPLRLVPSRFQYGDGYSPLGVVSGVGVQMNNMSMTELARFLDAFVLHRPVFDQTGLGGIYDFTSKSIVSDDEIGAASSEVILSAVKEMGLRLRETKGVVETIVIESALPPSAN